MRAAAVCIGVVCACEHESPSPAKPPDPERPRERASDDESLARVTPRKSEAPCPPSRVQTTPVVIAEDVYVIQKYMPLRWITSTKRIHELGTDPTRSRDLGPASAFRSAVWDDRYWYRERCYERCDNDTSMGVPTAIERIDRITSESVRLGRGDYGLGNILPFRDHVYWGVFGHQIDGGVSRVPKTGGAQEDIRTSDRRFEDRVSDLVPYPDGILVQGTRTISWIPASGEPARRVFEASDDTGPAVKDNDAFYVAEAGDPYWQSADSGYIHEITPGGETRKLAGPVRWPSAIATHGSNVYFMLRESGDVRVVSKKGGEVKVLIEGGATKPCDASLYLWADARGLFWLRGHRMPLFGNDSQTIYFASWTSLEGNAKPR